MIWLSVVSCLAAFGFAMIAFAALLTARRAFHQSAVTEALLSSTSQRIVELEQEVMTVQGQNAGLLNRIDQVSSRQARIESGSGKTGFNEAIAFARHGANTRELVDTCGLSQGEARLVQVLHGSHVDNDAEVKRREATTSESH